jgi:hypothetical protein
VRFGVMVRMRVKVIDRVDRTRHDHVLPNVGLQRVVGQSVDARQIKVVIRV